VLKTIIMEYKRLNTIIGWMVFIFATTVYFMTIEPTTSLWDCGEYITTAFKLEVGHPPGAPLFMMLGRLFTLFAGPDGAAMMVNLMSALSSSFTILFLFWTITMLAKKITLSPKFSLFEDKAAAGEIATKKEKVQTSLSEGQKWAVLGSGLIGALAYTFTDSFWFSAVEGEVYAMSSFFTAIVIWAIFKWDHELFEQENDLENVELQDKNADRWIVFIFFMIGLSIGVHLLNLLSIPALAYVIYFRKYKETTTAGFLLTGVIGVAALGIIQAVVIPKTVQIAGWFERFFVNALGMPFNAGTVFFFLALTGLIVGLLMWSKRNGKDILNTITWSATMIFIGYSCFAMIVIRSNANTPLDENDPENLVSLESYLKREQYGDWPIMYGQYFNSERNPQSEWGDRSDIYLRRFVVVNSKGEDLKGFKTIEEAKAFAGDSKSEIVEKYFKSFDGSNMKPTYKSSESTIFPRMYSPDERHVRGYKSWSGASGTKIPTMGENLTYFASYQVGWMYWRYFMWNFSGRQSDEQGHGGPFDGNWISGLNFIDQHHIGDQTMAPSIITENPSHNKFYMLPLILGIIGFIFMFMNSTKNWWLVMLLFLLTGFAIIIYLNQKPFEPRERDYAYAASFYAFSIWIGMSVLALYEAFKSMVWKELMYIVGGLVGLGLLFSIFQNLTAGVSFLYIGIVVGGAYALMIALRTTLKKEMHGAFVALILALPVPIIMGMQSWDDHDRSNRYTAEAIAHNYLTSCDDGAIIYTNGDNDTFPLWYLQEVEGEKTSVRVCNLSLLNTDWYTEQMTKQAYDSKPLPISFTEEQYRQNGLRDYMFIASTNMLTMRSLVIDPKWKPAIDKKISSNPELFKPAYETAAKQLQALLARTNFAEIKPELLAQIGNMPATSSYYDFRNLVFNLLQRSSEFGLTEQNTQSLQDIIMKFNDAFDYLPADYAMDFLKNDANTLEVQRGLELLTIPAKGLTINVDKDKAIANGIVDAKYEDRIVDKLIWDLPGQTIYKNDLMILDMVAHFDWDRAIYFGSSADRKTFLGLHKYFFSEGLVYKLVPVEAKQSRNPNTLGEINTDAMYENLMNKFEWGNMQEEGVLVDYYSRRLTNNYRVQFSVLADAYADEITIEKQKIDFMKKIQEQGAAVSNEPIPTPYGDIQPSQIPGELQKSQARIEAAQEKIIAVLDRSMEVMPNSNVPFKKVIPSYISTYYQAGAEEKAQNYSNQMLDIYNEEIDYMLSVDNEFGKRMIEDLFATYRSVFSLYQAATLYSSDTAYQEKMNAEFDAVQAKIDKGISILRKTDSATDKEIERTFDAFFARLQNGQ
jgi:hypothetical protein